MPKVLRATMPSEAVLSAPPFMWQRLKDGGVYESPALRLGSEKLRKSDAG